MRSGSAGEASSAVIRLRKSLDGLVQEARSEVRVDHPKIIVGTVGRDVSYLAEIPHAERAGPRPFGARQLYAAYRVSRLLLLRDALPCETALAESVGRCVPSVFVDPDGFA